MLELGTDGRMSVDIEFDEDGDLHFVTGDYCHEVSVWLTRAEVANLRDHLTVLLLKDHLTELLEKED